MQPFVLLSATSDIANPTFPLRSSFVSLQMARNRIMKPQTMMMVQIKLERTSAEKKNLKKVFLNFLKAFGIDSL